MFVTWTTDRSVYYWWMVKLGCGISSLVSSGYVESGRFESEFGSANRWNDDQFDVQDTIPAVAADWRHLVGCGTTTSTEERSRK